MNGKPRVVEGDGARKADLAAIHIAKAELGWTDDFYRDILFAKCRVRSSAVLDHAGRKAFLAHLRACGWSGGTLGTAAFRKTPTALTAPQRKMWSLWQQLADAGLVENRRMPALVAFAHRQTRVDRLEWLNAAQEHLVIESLKRWLKERRDGA